MFRLFWLLAEATHRIFAELRRLPRNAAIALGAPTAGHPARPKHFVQALTLILPIAFFAAWLVPQLTLVMSPSIPAWVVRAAPGAIAKGDYVRFRLRGPIAGPHPVSVTKRALCLPGDRLVTIETRSIAAAHARNGHYFCNGVLLGISLPFAAHGQRLTHLRWSGIVPPGMAYVGSPYPRGFDSRYFGLVPIAALTRMERVL